MADGNGTVIRDLSNVTRRMIATSPEYRGRWVARAAPWGDDGWVAAVELPLPDSVHAIQVMATIPPGTLQKVLDSSQVYQNQVNGWGFEDPYACDCGYGVVLAPGTMGEVGFVETLLAGLAPSLLGNVLGGGGGNLLQNVLGGGQGGGNLLQNVLGALGGQGGQQGGQQGAGQWARGNLPGGGTRENKARILGILGISDGQDAATVRARLAEGAARPWHVDDLTDARTMLALVPASGPVTVETLLGGSAPSMAGQTGLAQLLGQVLGGANQQVSPQQLAALLGGGSALLGAAQQAATQSGAELYGSLTPQVLDLLRRTLRGLDGTAAALGGSPEALALVQATRERTEQNIANAWRLFDALTSFVRSAR